MRSKPLVSFDSSVSCRLGLNARLDFSFGFSISLHAERNIKKAFHEKTNKNWKEKKNHETRIQLTAEETTELLINKKKVFIRTQLTLTHTKMDP